MKNARLYEAQAGIKIAGRNINNLRYADDTTLMAFLLIWDDFGHCLLYSVMNLCALFFRHSVYQIQSLETIRHFHCIIIRDLGHT